VSSTINSLEHSLIIEHKLDEEVIPLCRDFLAKLSESTNSVNIERNTRGQAGNAKWFEEKQIRITASVAGDILHKKSTTSPMNLVHKITKQQTISTRFMKEGSAREKVNMCLYIQYIFTYT
jgi:hypothetical protein